MPALAWGLEEAEAAADPGALVPAYILLSRYKRARGDLLGALEVVEAGEEKLRALEISGGHWFSLLAAQRVRPVSYTHLGGVGPGLSCAPGPGHGPRRVR